MLLQSGLKSIKLAVPIIVIAVFLFGFFCAGMFTKAMHMGVMNDGIMSMQGEQPCCNAGISHHFDSWKNVLVAVPEKIRDGFILLVLALALAVSFTSPIFRYRPPDPRLTAMRLYARQNPDFTLFNCLRLVFARGILNPKIY